MSVSSGCCSKIPRTKWLDQQRCVSELWRWELPDPGAHRWFLPRRGRGPGCSPPPQVLVVCWELCCSLAGKEPPCLLYWIVPSRRAAMSRSCGLPPWEDAVASIVEMAGAHRPAPQEECPSQLSAGLRLRASSRGDPYGPCGRTGWTGRQRSPREAREVLRVPTPRPDS